MRRLVVIALTLMLLTISVGCIDSKSLTAQATYSSEANDLINFMNNEIAESNTNNYSLINSSRLLKEEDAVRLEYEIFIQEPKVSMGEVIMSFHLADGMLDYLNANNVFQTNIYNEEFFDITPDGDIQGASLSRSFIADPSKIDDNILNIYRTMYIKISYTVASERIEDYFKMELLPSPEFEEYLIHY